ALLLVRTPERRRCRRLRGVLGRGARAVGLRGRRERLRERQSERRILLGHRGRGDGTGGGGPATRRTAGVAVCERLRAVRRGRGRGGPQVLHASGRTEPAADVWPAGGEARVGA